MRKKKHFCFLIFQEMIFNATTFPSSLFIALSLSLSLHTEVDSEQHFCGVGCPRVYRALEQVDMLLGKLVEQLEELNLLHNTTIIIAADHGAHFPSFSQHHRARSLSLSRICQCFHLYLPQRQIHCGWNADGSVASVCMGWWRLGIPFSPYWPDGIIFLVPNKLWKSDTCQAALDYI